MKDYSELKRLSDAATPGNWNHYRHGVIKGGPSIQFTKGSAQQQIAMTTGADWMRPDEQCANADFIAAANPAAVLELIAEVEALRNLVIELRGSVNCHNVHHCKSEQHDFCEPCKVLSRIDLCILWWGIK